MAARTYMVHGPAAALRVRVEASDSGHYRVDVDGEQHAVDARHLAGGTWSVIIDGESYDLELDVRDGTEFEATYRILVRDQRVGLRIEDERLLRMGLHSAVFQSIGPQTLRAPMPGRVVKVLVEAGAEVDEGTPLVVIEAMKMENEVKAPTRGRVVSVCVAEGRTVEGGAALLTME